MQMFPFVMRLRYHHQPINYGPWNATLDQVGLFLLSAGFYSWEDIGEGGRKGYAMPVHWLACNTKVDMAIFSYGYS